MMTQRTINATAITIMAIQLVYWCVCFSTHDLSAQTWAKLDASENPYNTAGEAFVANMAAGAL